MLASNQSLKYAIKLSAKIANQSFLNRSSGQLNQLAKRMSSDYSKFKEVLRNAKNVVAITGAGISAESGVPIFRGQGSLWHGYRSQVLATPEAFTNSPGLVWQFYAYRRDIVLSKQPNQAHYALAELEETIRLRNNGKLTVITQNIDELHKIAGNV